MDAWTYYCILDHFGRAPPEWTVQAKALILEHDDSFRHTVGASWPPPVLSDPDGEGEGGGNCRKSRLVYDEIDESTAELSTAAMYCERLGLARMMDRVCSDVKMICNNVENDYTGVEMMLRQDMSVNKVRWYGVWGKDLWCFLRNNNPVVSVCYSHYLHPISRRNRAIAMFSQILCMLYISVVLAQAKLCEVCDIAACFNLPCQDPRATVNASAVVPPAALARAFGREEGDAFVDKVVSTTVGFGAHAGAVGPPASWEERERLAMCCICNRVLVLWFFDIFGRIGGQVYATFANAAFALTVYPLMMCACVQHMSPRFRKLGEVVAYTIVGTLVAVMTFWAPAAFRIVWRHGLVIEFLANLVFGKCASWSFVTCLNVAVFTALWRWEGGVAQAVRVAPAEVLAVPQRHSAEPPTRFHVRAEDYVAYLAATRGHTP